MGPLGVTGIRVVDAVVKRLEQRDFKLIEAGQHKHKNGTKMNICFRQEKH